MVMLITVVALGFAAVPIIASLNTQSGATRDQAGNSALAAAEAGINLAVLRQSQVVPPATSPCVTESGGALVSGAAATSGAVGWCPAVGPKTVGSGTFTYRVKPCYSGSACYASPTNKIIVVGTGTATANGRTVSRRVAVTATSSAGTASAATNVFSNGQVVGIDSLTLEGNSKVHNGGAGSNGQVKLIDSSKVCGALRYGPGTTSPVGGVSYVPAAERPYSNGTGGGVCYPPGYPITQGVVTYPPVSLPADIATNNSNGRLAAGPSEDVSGETRCFRCNLSWNASNRTLEIKYSTLTMAGTAPYFLCGLTLTGGAKIIPAPGSKLRFFFDSPKNCPGLNGANQLTIDGGTSVLPDAGNGPGFYFAGSPTGTPASKVFFGRGASSYQMVIYAPYSSVVVEGGINLSGAILGRTLYFAGGAQINEVGVFTPPSSEEFVEVTATAPTPFARTAFIECSAAGSETEPATGC